MRIVTILQQHQSKTRSAPERCKSFTFDINQQAESLVQWEQCYNQLSNGSFNGYLDELKLNGIHFFEEFTSQSLQQHCSIQNKNCWLGFSLQHQRPQINNSKMVAGQIMLRPSEVEFELITPPDFHIYGLVLNEESLQNEMTGADAEHWLNVKNVAFSRPNHYVSYELAKLINLLLEANNGTSVNNKLFDNNASNRLKTLIPLINSKVADLLTLLDYDAKQESITQQTKKRVIADINHYIKQTNCYPLTTTELCQISNVSRRTLQYSFKEAFSMSPTQYIRDCRLNEIRRVLLNIENNDTITDLAINFGFFHAGTFNFYYKQLFGETPTQTKQRAGNYHNTNINSVTLR